MNVGRDLLEPAAEQILSDIAQEMALRRERSLSGAALIEPDLPRDADVHALSAAISAKRQADSLEVIAKAVERLSRAEFRGAILTQRRGA